MVVVLPGRSILEVLPPLAIEPALWHHFAGILLVILLAVMQARVGRVGPFWQICWSLFGIALHEFSHFFVGKLTGAQPTGFTILPHRDTSSGSGGWILGSVTINRPGPISSFPTGMAPLALNVVGFFLAKNWYRWFPLDLPHILLMYLTIYVFAYSSVPSGQDVKVAFSSLTGLLFYSFVGTAAWFYFH